MRLIGLTGGIATGKTTVARLLAARGAAIVDADELAHLAEAPGQPALADIVQRFGREVLRPDGTLDRERLGAIVFADAAARRDLEAITHPRISAMVAERVAAALAGEAQLVVVDVPLLFEGNRQSQFEGTLLVYAPVAVQIARLAERNGLDEPAARQRLSAQLPIDDKRARATWVIDNSGSEEATADEVARWWDRVVSDPARGAA